MKRLEKWYKDMPLSARVIISMNLAIFFAIMIISVLATINRINVQKKDARAMISNELEQITQLLNLTERENYQEIEEVIQSRILYNTGHLSLIDSEGNVLIDRNKKGENVANTEFFKQIRNQRKGEFQITDSSTGKKQYHYFTYYQPDDIYITATIDRKEFITKPVYNTLKILLFAMIFTWITFSTVNYFIMKTVTTPIKGLVNTITKMGNGELPDAFHYPFKDEVGQMTRSVNELLKGLKNTAIFAEEIGKNNFDHAYEPLSEKDVLGNALLYMRESLKTAKEEEQVRKVEDEKRNWTTQGLAKFADILRHNNDNMKELSYDIIKNLVGYLEVNQGGIFILNDHDEKNEPYLELAACYAFDRRKYLEKKIMPGEGLVGTCFLEKEPIYITEIPQDYIRITSGLGDENPSALLLIPLKVNEQIFGVIEMAAFQPLEKYKLEFVEKIGESIASTISSVKINTQTAMLLQKSQQQAEEMRAQEEEMRQNMEELTATQEAMAEKERENQETIKELNAQNQNKLDEFQLKEKELLETLENCPESVVKSNARGAILLFNKAAEKLWGFNREEVLGNDLKMLMPQKESDKHDEYMQNYLQTGVKKVIGKGREVWIKTKENKTLPVILTLVETRTSEEIFFTGFFTEKPLSNISAEETPNHPHDPAPGEPSTTDDENNQPTEGKKNEVKEEKGDEKSQQDNISDLYASSPTNTQKAWSEHLDEKGKGFKKGRKK
ncbi:MAG: PAS domain S-box protein [Bacteroidales bacterium]